MLQKVKTKGYSQIKIKEIIKKARRFFKSERKLRNRKVRAINGNGKGSNELKILQWNKGRLNIVTQMTEIRNMFRKFKPDIFVINEVELHISEDPNIMNVSGYTIEYDSMMKNNNIVRTVMYIRSCLNYQRLYKYELEDESVITISVGYPSKKRIFITGYYRQWSIPRLGSGSRDIRSMNIRFKKQAELWKSMITENNNREMIFVGDFNLDANNWRKSENEKTSTEKTFNFMNNIIKECLLDNGFSLLNMEPTRPNANRKSVLDHFYTNNVDKIKYVKTYIDTVSDHAAILGTRAMQIMQSEEQYILKRDFKKIDFEQVNMNILNDQRSQKIIQSEDTEYIGGTLIKMINEHLDFYSNEKKVKIQSDDKPPKCELIEQLVYRKKMVLKKFKMHGQNEDKNELKNLTNIIRKEKTKFERSLKSKEFENCQGNTNQMWKTAKKHIFGSNIQNPDKMMENGVMNFGSKKVANIMNRFYVSKIRKLKEKMPEPNADPLTHFKKFVKKPKNQLFFRQITSNELEKIYSKINKSNSTSHDRISMNTLNKLKSSTKYLILHFINMVILTEKIPKCIKISKIVPIKKNSKMNSECANWRPINLQSPISKLMEKVLVKQINHHLIKNKILDPNMQGALKNRNTTISVLGIYQKLAELKRKKN